MAKKSGVGGQKSKQPSWGNLLQSFLSYALTTWLLSLFNKSTDSGSTDDQQPSKFTEDNTNQIGACIPVVLGRAMIKDPLISYYGSFRADPYTEEYGMWTDMDFGSMILAILIAAVITAFIPKMLPVIGAMPGVADGSQESMDNQIMMGAVQQILFALLASLFTDHEGKTTIQKGFKYFLGWQHILCWTGENIGLKSIWMNVYDADVEESKTGAVWDAPVNGQGKPIAYKNNNQLGVICTVDDDDMFGGPDEGGGFVGEIRVYLGTDYQSRDPWMEKEMNNSTAVDPALKGLTPKYPWFVTAVISDADKDKGAYIGKQATIPEMWFEIVNYPEELTQQERTWADDVYKEFMEDAYNLLVDFFEGKVQDVENNAQNPTVKPYTDFKNNEQTLHDHIYKRCDIKIERDTGNEQNERNDYMNIFDNVLKPVLPPELVAEFDELVGGINYTLDLDRFTISKIGDDLNPGRVIKELLFNPLWGAEYKDYEVDMYSVIRLACRLEWEKLGVSCLINNTAQVKEYLNKLLSHVGGVMFDDPTTGQLTFKLIRDDFNLDNIKHFTIDNCSNMEFTRLDWGETVDTVTIQFTNPDDDYCQNELIVNDIANRLITGRRVERSIDGTWYCTDSNARWLADTNMKSLGYPLCSIRFDCNRYGYDVKAGDPIRVTWEPYGIATQVFRVTDVDYGHILDGKITISALEDVFSFGRTDYGYVEPVKWRDEEKEPWEIARYEYVEVPYEMHMTLDTYVKVFVSRPHVLTDHYNVWRWDGSDFKVTVTSSEWAIIGRPEYGYDEDYPNDPNGFTFYVVGEGTEGLLRAKIQQINQDPTKYTNTSGLNLAIIDDEIISYGSIDELGQKMIGTINPQKYTIFQFKDVVRGVYDTVPQKHTTESKIILWEKPVDINGGNKLCSAGDTSTEEIELRSGTTSKDQDFEPSAVEIYNTKRRAEAPSPMGNLKIAADRGDLSDFQYNAPPTVQFSGDLLFNGIPRNKFQDTSIIAQDQYPAVYSLPTNLQNTVLITINGNDYLWSEPATLASGIMVEEFRLPWYVICSNFFNDMKKWLYIDYMIRTYNPDDDLYSFGAYKKTLYVRTPYFAGAETTEQAMANWADQVVLQTGVGFRIPATNYNPQISLDNDVCVFMCVGTQVAYSPQVPSIMAQDGKFYIPSKFFRIDGRDAFGNLKYHEITDTVKEHWVFTHNFNNATNNDELAVDYNDGQFTSFTFV